jgi:hypothetical protein
MYTIYTKYACAAISHHPAAESERIVLAIAYPIANRRSCSVLEDSRSATQQKFFLELGTVTCRA